jgi:two-component system, sensor histidine kinase and response regulator
MESILNNQALLKDLSTTEPLLRILLVEDNPGDVLIVKELLKASGINFTLAHAPDLKGTFSMLIDKEYDVILLDLGLPGSTGLETLRLVMVFKIKSPIVVMTGLDDEDLALASLREGAQDYLVKHKLTSDNILRSIKYGIERKKIQDLQRRHTHQFSILSSATGLITRSEDTSYIYTITCENIELLLDNANAISLEFTDPDNLLASSVEWLKPWSDKIKTLTGVDIYNPVFQLPNHKKEFLELFNDGKLHEIKGGLYEIFTGNVDQNNCSELEKLTGIKNIYTIGFKKGENFYGGAIIFSPRVIEDDEINIIETISSQASLSIHKRLIEKELRLSEYRYRKLSKELEKKVKERTKDLESVNFRLNQELMGRDRTQKILKNSEAQLKELNATKDKFFNIVAHDLKNPFTSLLGSSELLFDNIHQMDPENIRKLAMILNDSAKSGYAILQNLLDWSRSQTGLLKFNPEEINLKNLIDENILNLKLFSANKEIEIHSEVKEDMVIFADKNMINTILRNLLSNSVKFTQRGGKVVVDALKDPQKVTVSVADTGIGISAENIEKLFRIDTKHSLPGTNNEQGTGLGLKLSKEFVEKQGGRIWVESIENKGSEFKFSIPVIG